MQQFRAQQRILGYPSASPEELARRSIEAAPPFKGEDRGLRDTLIWLCVKEFLKSTDFTDITVVLVTKDKAFYDSNERVALSTHLVRELENAGIPRDSVIAKTDIQAVIDDPISSMLSTVQGIKKKIKSGEIEGFAADDHLISNAANDWLLGHANLFHSILSNYPIMGFSLLYETSLENVTQVLALGDGKVSASSVWVGELFPIVDELREIEDFGRYGIDCPRVSIEFTVSSLPVSSLLGKAKCRWFVETHEVVRMNIKVDGVALN